jgi:agmatinase
MPYLSTNFGLLEPESSDYETSRVAVLPVPFERTVSYGKGTSAGPAAIIRASQSMELYDEELGAEPYLQGIATLPPFLPEAYDMAEAMAELQEEARTHLEKGKFLVTLGGEHSITQAPVRATKEVHGEIGVVQFDAHADLRDSYTGTSLSHASAMRRVLEIGPGVSLVSIGIRCISAGEIAYFEANRDRIRIHFAKDQKSWRVEDIVAPLRGRPVYISFDVDGLDASLMPATGTPEAGGLFFLEACELLRAVAETGNVVGADLVELAPMPGYHAADYIAAKLAYKIMSYVLAKGQAPRG